jgi:hypothetical protein
VNNFFRSAESVTVSRGLFDWLVDQLEQPARANDVLVQLLRVHGERDE